MASESVYVKVEYTDKVRLLAKKLKIPESQVRQSCLELGIDTMLALTVVSA